MKRIDDYTTNKLLREGFSANAIKITSQLWARFNITGYLTTQNAQINNAAGKLQSRLYMQTGEFVEFATMRKLLLKVLRLKMQNDEN